MVDFLNFDKTFQDAMANPMFHAGLNLLSGQPFQQAMQGGVQSASNMQQVANQKMLAEQKKAEAERLAQERAAQEQFAQKMGLGGMGLSPTESLNAYKALQPKQNIGFQGTSMDAQSWNILNHGDPSSPEYAAAYSILTQPKTQYVPKPDGTMALIQYTPKLPEGVKPPLSMRSPEEMPVGEGKAIQKTPQGGVQITDINTGKIDFNQNQTESAGFALRMEAANETMERLMKEGYDPTSPQGYKDYELYQNPLTRGLVSPAGQEFIQAAVDFTSANLRSESGAVISDPEQYKEVLKYIPTVGEKENTTKAKERSRNRVFKAMKFNSQGGYDYLKKQSAEEAKQQAIPLQQVPKESLKVGQQYQLPNGDVMKWTGEGFE